MLSASALFRDGFLFLGRTIRLVLLRAIPLIVVLAVWEVVSRYEIVNPRLFPAPSQAWLAFVEWYRTGDLYNDFAASYWRALAGLGAGGCLGIALGMATGRSRFASAVLAPLVQILRPLPPVAIIPLIIVWLGIGNNAKIFSIAFAVFFPVWLNTHLGAAHVAQAYLWSAKLLSKSRVRTILRVMVPATLPSIIAGLRTAIPLAFVMVFVSELAGASEGLGYRISLCHLAYRIDMMMAALAVLAGAGALADLCFAAAVHLVFPWTRSLSGR